MSFKLSINCRINH